MRCLTSVNPGPYKPSFWRSLLLSLLIIAPFLMSCSSNRGGANGGGPISYAPGASAGSFTLRDPAGNPVSLSDFRGKVVLLNFWASWCGPCVEELPALQKLYSKLNPRGFVVLGVAVDDTPESVAEFVQRFGITFPVAIDPDGAVKRAFKLNGVPESFTLDRNGAFVMVIDPANDQPVVRILGPRMWDSPRFISQLSALLP